MATSDVIDLTDKMAADGTLDWTAPAGNWVVLRMGYTLTGATNHPVPKEALGLEVDKLNKDYVKQYMETYLNAHADFLGPNLMGGHGVRSVLVDSIETGPQNWTDDLLAQFQRLRGYDARPWLPTLTGVIIQSAAASDRFLWDFRRTIGELTASAHYGEVVAVSHAHGLRVYGESLESSRIMLGDDMEARRFNDFPMGSVATNYPFKAIAPTGVADALGAASDAHLYGQNIAASETFTTCGNAPWTFAPSDLKPIADSAFAFGINRIFIHSSVHQPLDKAPGLTLGVCGIYFNRLDTWAEQAGPWISYLSRSSYLLQQGRFAGDVVYFYGEEAPLITLKAHGRLEDAPTANGVDFVSSDALLNLLDVSDGYLVTRSGMKYRVLQLGGASERMTVPVLRKIRDLVQNGAIVVGHAPSDTPSLADNAEEYQQLRTQLWGQDGGGSAVGLGHVYGDMNVADVLAKEGGGPDFSYSRPNPDTKILFLHRTLPDAEIYFLSNQQNREEDVDATFRVSGKVPEFWHAETGTAQPASFRIENGHTTVPLKLTPFEAVFVVFRKPARIASLTVPSPVSKELAQVQGPWTVQFAPGRGAPRSITLDKLQSWSDSGDQGVKYFSGMATYSKTLSAPSSWFTPGRKIALDLGEVRELAQVFVNGKDLGTVWHTPFVVDVSSAIRPGNNRLEIKVTNLWVNRLIGDKQPGATKYTSTAIPTYLPTAPLHPSGLIGPVHMTGVEQRPRP